jgi:hypothetical protein
MKILISGYRKEIRMIINLLIIIAIIGIIVPFSGAVSMLVAVGIIFVIAATVFGGYYWIRKLIVGEG